MTRELGMPLDRLQRAEQLMNQGEFNEALQIVELIENMEELEDEKRLAGNILKSQILTRMGDIEDGLRLAEKAIAESQRLKNPLQIVDACITTAEALERVGEYDESLDVIEKGENVLTTLVVEPPEAITPRTASLIYWKGRICLKKGQVDQALEYFQQSLSFFEELGNKREIALSLNSTGAVYINKGDLKRGLEYFQKSLELRKEIGNKKDIADSLNNIGVFYFDTGEWNQALDYMLQSLTIYEELCNKDSIALSLGNIGEIHRNKGELNQALDYFQQSLEFYEEIGNKTEIGWCLGNIGMTYRLTGEFDLALEHLMRGFELIQKIDNKIITSKALFELITVAISKCSLELAQGYLQPLQQINNQVENRIVNHAYRVAKAMILKTSPRMRDKAGAQEIFQQIVEEEIAIFEYTIVAMLNLCELLLDELKAYGEDAVLQEAKTLVKKIYALAQKQQSFTLVVDVLILRARFAIIDGDLKTAMKFLDQARVTAEDKTLNLHAERVSAERQYLEEECEKSQKLIQRHATFQERLEQARLNAYIKEAMKLVGIEK